MDIHGTGPKLKNHYANMPIFLLVKIPKAKAIVMTHIAKQKGLDPELVLRCDGSFSDLFRNMGGGLEYDVLYGICEDLQELSDKEIHVANDEGEKRR